MRAIRDLFEHPAGRAAVGLLAAAAGWATLIEPRWLRVQRLTLALPQLPEEFDGYRIVHFSDQHLGVPGARAMLARTVQAVKRETPNLIVMTGDLITWSSRERVQSEDAAPLADLDAPDGVWSVLGNHDYVDPAFVGDLLARNGITQLRNQSHLITRGSARLALIGLDDMVWGAPDLPSVLASLDNTPAILLAHEPDIAPAAAAYSQIVLQLSGHTHGGQIVPVPGHPLILPRYGRTHFRGLEIVQRMPLYVTTGTGTGRFILRWNSRPEIVVITLRHPRAAPSVV